MIETLCPEDIQLWPIVLGGSIAPELQSHLDQCPVCQSRLDSLRDVVHAVREIGCENAKEPSHSPLASELPESIGEYPILARLGSGGQADVYRAWHPRLKTDVVIKWFRADTFPESDSFQLTRLVQILCTIRHPHLGQVYDVGIDHGRHFMIMEYINGPLFSTWIRKFKPTIPHIASVLSKAAHAVDAVHKQGALHLDLKPGNVMIDDMGEPRVIDFGMAQQQEPGDRRSWLLAPGTPEYMSPEQFAGDVKHISVASDVYGLGAVLYAALCDHPIRTSDHMRLVPDWSLIRSAPWPIRRICHKALAVRAQDRYDSALAFARDLERFTERHSRLRRAMAVVLILLGVGSLLWGVAASHRSQPSTSLIIEDQRQTMYAGRQLTEIRCSAVLANSHYPGLLIATATSAPTNIKTVTEEFDAVRHLVQLRIPHTRIQIDNTAGPFLVLAYSRPDWTEPPLGPLRPLLQALPNHPFKHPLEILVNPHKIQLVSNQQQVSPREVIEIQNSILGMISKIQDFLNLHLLDYSGVVIIPSKSIRVTKIDGNDLSISSRDRLTHPRVADPGRWNHYADSLGNR